MSDGHMFNILNVMYTLGDEEKGKLLKKIKNLRSMLIKQKKIGEKPLEDTRKIMVLNCKVDDLDENSQYPGAMSRLGREIGGLLMGVPKAFNNEEEDEECEHMSMTQLQEQDGYFMNIDITKVGKKRKFPLISRKNEEGIRIHNNDTGTMWVNRINLEDLIKFQEIEFKTLKGYYFKTLAYQSKKP